MVKDCAISPFAESAIPAISESYHDTAFRVRVDHNPTVFLSSKATITHEQSQSNLFFCSDGLSFLPLLM